MTGEICKVAGQGVTEAVENDIGAGPCWIKEASFGLMGIYTAKKLLSLPHHQNAARCPQDSLNISQNTYTSLDLSSLVSHLHMPYRLYAVAAGASDATCSISILGMAAPVPPRSVWRAFGFLV